MNRRHTINIITVSLLLAMSIAAGPAAAFQDGYRNGPAGWHLAAKPRGIPWDSLSREERKLLKKHKGGWSSYPPERQQQLRNGAQRYLRLPPDELESVERKRRQYEQLSPRERQQLREKYRRQQR